MSLVTFHDHVFLQYKHLWFVWESSWETFRPIETIQWTGSCFETRDSYSTDPTDPLYGFGSESMKKVCDLLKTNYSSQMKDAKPVRDLLIGTPTWFRDRRIVLSPCASTDTASWKRMVGRHARTCRVAPRGSKFTRRSR
jgi:hypothetical protein